MLCPRNVLAPSEDPVGATNPFGNGLFSVRPGVRKLLLLPESDVVELKPIWSVIAVEEYVPTPFRLARLAGVTNNPKPPRKTVFPCSAAGLSEKPNRGLIMFVCTWYGAPPLPDGNVKPPRVLNPFAASTDVG